MTSSTSSSEPRGDARPAPPIPDRIAPPVPLSRLQAAVAVVLPLLLLALVLGWWWRPAPQELSEAARAMDLALQEAPPDVVVIGNSVAREGVDPDALSEALGGLTVVPLTIVASPPPTWYAMLKNRVVAGGHQPDIIVIIGTMSFFTMTEVRTDLQRVALAEQVLADEPVIAAKTFGSAVGRVPQRVEQRRSDLREALVEAGRLSLLRLFEEDPAAVAAEASEAVFEAEGAVDLERRQRVIPVVEVQRQDKVSDEIEIEDTYVPDLVEAARRTGAHVVFVKAPLPPSAVAKVPSMARTERKLVAWLNEHDAGWLDLSEMGLGESMFRDAGHVNRRGREAFTAALAEGLARMGATGEGELATAALPVVASEVRRDGAAPALPAVDAATATSEGACLVVAERPELAALSTNRLRNRDAWGAEPLLLLQDGEPLARLERVQDLDPAQCQGAWVHDGKRLRISPRRPAPPAAGGQPLDGLVVAPALDPAATLTTAQGRRWHWLYGGTSLSFAIADGLDPAAGRLSVAVELDVLEKLAPELLAAGPLAWLVVTTADGVELDRAPVAALPEGAPGVLSGELETEPPTGPFEVRLVAEASLPPAVVRSLGVGGSETGLDWVAGSDARLSSLRLLGGKAVSPRYEGQAVAVAPGASLSAGPRSDVGRFVVPELSALSRFRVHQAIGQFNCSPIDVLEDGVPLPHPHAGCKKIESGKAEPGSTCHEGNALLFSTTDGTSPLDNGRAYTLGLDGKHTCKSAWWLHPGETLVREVSQKELHSLRRGADTLVLTAVALGVEDGKGGKGGKGRKAPQTDLRPIELRLAGKDTLYLKTQLRPEQLDGQPLRLPLDQPVTGSAQKLRAKLISPEGAPHVLIELAVLESSGAD